MFLATRHWLSALGVALASFCGPPGCTWALAACRARPCRARPTSYLILPVIFVLGPGPSPSGCACVWQKREKAGQPDAYPVLDFNNTRLRTIVLWLRYDDLLTS